MWGKWAQEAGAAARGAVGGDFGRRNGRRLCRGRFVRAAGALCCMLTDLRGGGLVGVGVDSFCALTRVWVVLVAANLAQQPADCARGDGAAGAAGNCARSKCRLCVGIVFARSCLMWWGRCRNCSFVRRR